jgi:hypothetical protein
VVRRPLRQICAQDRIDPRLVTGPLRLEPCQHIRVEAHGNRRARRLDGLEPAWTDPIAEEARRAREAYAASFDYDLAGAHHDLVAPRMRAGEARAFEELSWQPGRALCAFA